MSIALPFSWWRQWLVDTDGRERRGSVLAYCYGNGGVWGGEVCVRGGGGERLHDPGNTHNRGLFNSVSVIKGGAHICFTCTDARMDLSLFKSFLFVVRIVSVLAAWYLYGFIWRQRPSQLHLLLLQTQCRWDLVLFHSHYSGCPFNAVRELKCLKHTDLMKIQVGYKPFQIGVI